MSLRSRQARWFEVYVRRDQSFYALEALSNTHSVQLELDPRFSGPVDLETLRRRLAEFQRLAQAHREDLPPADEHGAQLTGTPEHTAAQILKRMQTWHEQLDALYQQNAHAEAMEHHLRLLSEAVAAMGDAARDLPALRRDTGLLYKGLYACPTEPAIRADFSDAVERVFSGERHSFLVLAALPEGARSVQEVLDATGCWKLDIPDDLAEDPSAQRTQLQHRLNHVEQRRAELQRQVSALRQDPEVAKALGQAATLKWFATAARAISGEGRRFCHITGWTTEDDPQRLLDVLAKAHVEADLRFPDPPLGVQEPVGRENAGWMRAFQIFTDMWGTPGAQEVNPTPIISIVVPLLFGYMFPDLGHGLILALVGVVARRRWPRARFLLPCGIAAAAFGLVFGETFGVEYSFLPWRIDAMDDPLMVLLGPMVFGAGLLLLGLVFNGLEAHWRGELKSWLKADAAVLLLYASVLASLAVPAALALTGLAIAWYIAGATLSAGAHKGRRLAAAIGELAHGTLSLALNTISFVRVGAFALAHVGLSGVVTSLAAETPSGWLAGPILVAGHAFVIALEGLLVFVQTTRLVLFEFFIRFLRAGGRVFEPLSRTTQS